MTMPIFTPQERRRMRLFETFDLRAGEQFLQAIAAPVDRLLDMPAWAQLLALLGGVAQFVEHDTFGGALAMVLFSGIVDYWCGVKAARFLGVYDPKMAHAGAMGKITGILLLLIMRLMEHLVFTEGLINTHGALATSIGVSLILVDLQSISHHRETFGATPIPVVSKGLGVVRDILEAKFPGAPKA
jgi:phage-related holin